MSTTPIAPPVLAGGFILFDAEGKTLLRSIPFQYNPDTLTRTLTPRAAKAEGGDRLEALRLVGPPVETIKFDAEFDAVDRVGGNGGQPGGDGVAGDLAAIEMIISPASADIAAEARSAATGTLEILPAPSPMLVVVLGPNRILPVRITDLGVVEEMFDTRLTPIRARVSLTLRVLNTDDLAPGSKGASLYVAALQRRERLAGARRGGLSALGLSGAP
jgi:hypothetical protein